MVIDKIKKIVEKAKNILILPSPDFRKDIFPACLALFYSLKKIGKNVNLIIEDHPSKFNFLIRKNTFHFPKSDYLISVKEAGVKISELSYEKTENGLNLYLKTNGGELKKENIALQPLGVGELLITLGIPKLEEVKEFIKERPKLIINIDNQIENENYGDLNLIEVSTPSFSEIVFDLLISLDKKLIDKEIINCLVAGILQGTQNFQDPKTNSQTFQKLSFLMEKGANLSEIISHLWSIEKENTFWLFGKILSKLNFSPEYNLAWVLLKKEDFFQTNSSPSDLKFALEKLASGIFPFQNFFCLWESQNSPRVIKGVFYSPNKELIETILKYFRGDRKGNGVLFETQSSDLSEVRDNILEKINL